MIISIGMNLYLETLGIGDHSIIVAYGDREEATTNFTIKASDPTQDQATYTLTATVDGGHGTAEVLGGKTEFSKDEEATLQFKPDSGYEIDKVTVNGVKTDVLDNLLTVKMDEDKTVVVTYKKISEGQPTDSTKPADPAKPEPEKPTPIAGTGYSTDMALWMALLMVSCGGIATTIFVKRKRVNSK